jgi:hypothetical protein
MAQSQDRRGATPRTLIKFAALLALALAGVAALAAEPDQAPNVPAVCARTSFDFGGRVVQNGETTDNWTLTCWRAPAPPASAPVPMTAEAAPHPAPVAPMQAMPVAGKEQCCTPRAAQF